MAITSKTHFPILANPHSSNNGKDSYEIQEFLEENDVYDEPGIDDIKVPISITEMKKKAQGILEQRRSLIKRKSHTPETHRSKTPNHPSKPE